MAIMIRFLFALGMIALAAASAAAQSKLPPFDPARIEFATPTTQSSTCLGDRRDAQCLAQTVVICGILPARRECVGQDYPGHYNPDRYERIEYRTQRAGIVPFEQLEAMQEFLFSAVDVDQAPMTKRRAVIAQYMIQQRICANHATRCDGAPWVGILVTLEQIRGRWIYIHSALHHHDRWFAD